MRRCIHVHLFFKKLKLSFTVVKSCSKGRRYHLFSFQPGHITLEVLNNIEMLEDCDAAI